MKIMDLVWRLVESSALAGMWVKPCLPKSGGKPRLSLGVRELPGLQGAPARGEVSFGIAVK